MPPYRVIVLAPDSNATTIVMMVVDPTPEIGDTLILPHHLEVRVRHVVHDPDGKLGVIIADPV